MKVKNLIQFFIIMAGAVLFIYFFNSFFHMTYSNEGSFDVFTGAILEVFVFSMLLEIYDYKQTKKMEKHIENHLREVENIIEKRSKK